MKGFERLVKPSKRKLISAFVKESKILFKDNPGLKSFGWDQHSEDNGRSYGVDFSVKNNDCLIYINGISIGDISDGYIDKPEKGLREIASLHREYASLTKKLDRLKKAKVKPTEEIKELETSIDEIMDFTGEAINCMFKTLLKQLAEEGNERYQRYYDEKIAKNKNDHLFRYHDEIFQELLQIWTDACHLTKIVEKALASVDPELLKHMFGDGTRVTVTANGITTKPNDEWDHEGCCKSICECSR